MAPSYVPDPVLFGLDTPPWMPCEDDLLPLWRSKEVLERMDCVFKPSGASQINDDSNKREETPNPQNDEEEKKDSERDTCDGMKFVFILKGQFSHSNRYCSLVNVKFNVTYQVEVMINDYWDSYIGQCYL